VTELLPSKQKTLSSIPVLLKNKVKVKAYLFAVDLVVYKCMIVIYNYINVIIIIKEICSTDIHVA
jgi:hypothetical protein